MKSYAQQLLDVFLPAGYPQSVTDDYIQYVNVSIPLCARYQTKDITYYIGESHELIYEINRYQIYVRARCCHQSTIPWLTEYVSYRTPSKHFPLQ